ncbi:hypothetical protein ACI2IP_06545 [Microbacterium sp. NPDC090218]
MIESRVERILLRQRKFPPVPPVPSLVTDVETVFDVVDRVGARWSDEAVQNGTPADIVQNFWVDRGEVRRNELVGLGVHELNSLWARVTVGERILDLRCREAQVYVIPEGQAHVREAERLAVTILLQGGSWRPTWRRYAFLTPWIPTLAVLVGFGWLLVGGDLHPGAVLAGAGIVALVVGMAGVWSVGLWKRIRMVDARFRVRAQSRQELYAARADRWANLRVAAVTAPVTLIVTVLAAWASGWRPFG